MTTRVTLPRPPSVSLSSLSEEQETSCQQSVEQGARDNASHTLVHMHTQTHPVVSTML